MQQGLTYTFIATSYFGNMQQAAAKRLAYYWKIRRKLFGPHRAYLPMTLDHNGALADDRKLLDSGFLSVHPNDERGRTVLAIDRIKVVPPFATRDAAVRHGTNPPC
jgi:hypothetical protein